MSGDGEGGFRYVGLIDEIEINPDNRHYRFPKMKPGEDHHGGGSTTNGCPPSCGFGYCGR